MNIWFQPVFSAPLVARNAHQRARNRSCLAPNGMLQARVLTNENLPHARRECRRVSM